MNGCLDECMTIYDWRFTIYDPGRTEDASNLYLSKGAVIIEPEVFEGFANIGHGVDISRLYQESVDAEFVGAVDVAFVSGRAEDDDDNRAQGRLLANPREDIEAHFVRQLEIEKNDARQRKAAAVGEWSRPG